MIDCDSIIFDVDGTLWNACDQVAKIWSAEAERYTGRHYGWDGPALERQFGRTMDDILADLVPELTRAQQEELGERFFAAENAGLMADPGILYPGVAEAIPRLARRKPLFIVSNCQAGYIETLLDSYDLRRYFTGWLSWGETHVPKDETLRLLMERYGLRRPVYVGDTQGDADSCARAGIKMVWAAYGLGEVRAPDWTVERFSDLLALFPAREARREGGFAGED